MPFRRPLQTLAIIASLSLAPLSRVAAQPSPDHAAHVDSGSAGSAVVAPSTGAPDQGSGTAAPAAGSGSQVAQPAASSSSVKQDDPESLAKAAYKAVTTKDWFLLAGVACAALSFIVQIPMRRKWSVFKGKHADRVAWAVTGLVAGLGALATAWLADVPVATTQTAYGALKVFAGAVFAYVSSKKLFGTTDTTTTPST